MPLGGGLMSLISYGAQDLYLTDPDPQVTYFKTQQKQIIHQPLSLQRYAQKTLSTKDTLYVLSNCQDQFPEMCEDIYEEIRIPFRRVLCELKYAISHEVQWINLVKSNKTANRCARIREKRLTRQKYKHNFAGFRQQTF